IQCGSTTRCWCAKFPILCPGTLGRQEHCVSSSSLPAVSRPRRSRPPARSPACRARCPTPHGLACVFLAVHSAREASLSTSAVPLARVCQRQSLLPILPPKDHIFTRRRPEVLSRGV